MRAVDLINDYSSRSTKDTSDRDAIIKAIEKCSGDSDKLLNLIAELVKSLGEKKEKVQSLQPVNVNFDTESLIESIKNISIAPPEYKAPVINVDNSRVALALEGLSKNKTPESYEFNIKRGNNGKIVSVIANPI